MIESRQSFGDGSLVVVIAAVDADTKVQQSKTLSMTQDTNLFTETENGTCTPKALSLVSESKAAKLPRPELL